MPFEFEAILNEQSLLLFVFSYPQGSTIQEVNWPGPLNEGFRPEYDAICTLGVCTHALPDGFNLCRHSKVQNTHIHIATNIPSVLMHYAGLQGIYFLLLVVFGQPIVMQVSYGKSLCFE